MTDSDTMHTRRSDSNDAPQRKILLVCKSDTTGGAAVVTLRLMNALREEGVDARMLVAEKLSDSPYVALAASPRRLKAAFLMERLIIFIRNGLSRRHLFDIDTAECGVDISRHPWTRQADTVILSWVNQGMISLKGIRRLLAQGKKVAWTMHDMWCMTGICHHAADCTHFADADDCLHCPLSPRSKMGRDTFGRKAALYSGHAAANRRITFIPVSRWLANKAADSTLLRHQKVVVIPNPFDIKSPLRSTDTDMHDHKIGIIFGAARLDAPIKGWPTLVDTLQHTIALRPDLKERIELITYGSVRDPQIFSRLPIPHRHLGRISPERLPEVYSLGDIVISASDYETLPGTLVEGQAYGCIPVAFDAGGQRDIIDHGITGFIATHKTPEALAEALLAAIDVTLSPRLPQFRMDMRQSVTDRFAPHNVARRMLDII